MPRLRPPLSSLILSAVLAVGGAIALLSFPPAVAGDRSGKWPAIEKKFLADHPTCAFCGKDASVVHHVRPFAEYPEDELLESNLLALCPECHGTIAHLNRHFDHWNPLVVQEAKLHAAMVAARPKTKAEAAAFVKRFGRCFEPANYQTAP